MKLRQPRIRHEKTFKERLIEQPQRFRDEAEKIPHGTARELLLKRARHETASHMSVAFLWIAVAGMTSRRFSI
jgi:hypothetical protein